MKNLLKLKAVLRTAGIIALATVIGFSMIACEEDGGGDTEISWTGLTANGTANSVTTTELTLTFNKDPEGLSISDVTVTGATKGTLSSSGATRTLTISNITVAQGENVTVALADPEGYAITPSTQTVAINKGSGSNSTKYRVEIYSITRATWDHLSNTYSGKTISEIERAAVISRGHSTINTYTNQTFEDVISKFTSDANAVGLGSDKKKDGVDGLTRAFQTNNQKDYCCWYYSGSTNRFFYAKRVSTDNYTVEIYSITRATWDHLSDTYSGKTISEIERADVISRGHSTINTYTNQTFEDVISKFTSDANAVGLGSDKKKDGTDGLTNAFQTNNQKDYCCWYYSGSTNRFFYVRKE